MAPDPAPEGPEPLLHMALMGATCSTGPWLAGAGTTRSTVPELMGQATYAVWQPWPWLLLWPDGSGYTVVFQQLENGNYIFDLHLA